MNNEAKAKWEERRGVMNNVKWIMDNELKRKRVEE